jgi:hypothetical protein
MEKSRVLFASSAASAPGASESASSSGGGGTNSFEERTNVAGHTRPFSHASRATSHGSPSSASSARSCAAYAASSGASGARDAEGDAEGSGGGVSAAAAGRCALAEVAPGAVRSRKKEDSDKDELNSATPLKSTQRQQKRMPQGKGRREGGGEGGGGDATGRESTQAALTRVAPRRVRGIIGGIELLPKSHQLFAATSFEGGEVPHCSLRPAMGSVAPADPTKCVL